MTSSFRRLAAALACACAAIGFGAGVPAAFAEDKQPQWTLAASEFSGTSELTAVLPSLILSSFSDSLERYVDEEELVDRKRAEIAKKLPEAVGQLRTAVKNRDSLVLSGANERTKQEKLAGYEKDIAAARERITAVKNYTELETFEPEPLMEQVVLYKGDVQSLYNATNLNDLPALASEAGANGINGLIIGSVTERRDYLFVTVELVLFPAGRIIGMAQSVFSKNSADTYVGELAQELMNAIVNRSPVTLTFDISPERGTKLPPDLTVHLDGLPLVDHTRSQTVQRGIHHLRIEASGYKTQAFSYDFSEKDRYRIRSVLSEEIELTLSVNAATEMSFWKRLFGEEGTEEGNIVYVEGGTARNNGQTTRINGLPVLGEAVGEDGFSTFFVIQPPKQRIWEIEPQGVASGDTVASKVLVHAGDTAAAIDKTRRGMYTSFGVLLLSLPSAFYLYGKLLDITNTYNSNRYVAPSQAEQLMARYNLYNGLFKANEWVSIGLGINWAIQLARYVITANRVLPVAVPAEIEGDLMRPAPSGKKRKSVEAPVAEAD